MTRTLDFTPSDSIFLMKLPSLHSYGASKVLPNQLLSGTPYPKYVEELDSIISYIVGEVKHFLKALKSAYATSHGLNPWALLEIL